MLLEIPGKIIERIITNDCIDSARETKFFIKISTALGQEKAPILLSLKLTNSLESIKNIEIT